MMRRKNGTDPLHDDAVHMIADATRRGMMSPEEVLVTAVSVACLWIDGGGGAQSAARLCRAVREPADDTCTLTGSK